MQISAEFMRGAIGRMITTHPHQESFPGVRTVKTIEDEFKQNDAFRQILRTIAVFPLSYLLGEKILGNPVDFSHPFVMAFFAISPGGLAGYLYLRRQAGQLINEHKLLTSQEFLDEVV